jgi:hypothetical protein
MNSPGPLTMLRPLAPNVTPVHGLDSFDRRNVDLQQAGALVVVGAFDHGVIDLARLAVDFGLQRACRVEELRVLLLHRGHAQGQVCGLNKRLRA